MQQRPMLASHYPFAGGYWLVAMISFDGIRGWRFEIKPISKERKR